MANSAFRAENGLYVEGSANVSGNMRVSGDLIVSGSLSSSVNAAGDIIPSSNSLLIGNSTARWAGVFTRDLNANGVSTLNAVSIAGTLTVTQNVAIDTNVLFVDAVNNRVGINRTPAQALDVSGTVNATSLIGALAWSNVTSKPSPNIVVTLTGDVTGTGNVTLTELAGGTITVNTTIQPNSIALGTDTTGNYVASVTNADASMVVSGGIGENITITVAHADTSSLANVSLAGGNVVTGLAVDTYGHLQTVTSSNLDSRYALLSGSTITGNVTVNTAVVLRGGAASANGGRVIIGFGNNLAAAITGSANSTWQLAALANNNLTLSRLSNTGTELVVMSVPEGTGVVTFANDIFVGANRVFHEGNDGATSGLDAQFLQGLIPGTGTTNIPVSNGTLMGNLNAFLLNSQNSSFYTNATNLTTGTVPTARLGSGTANSTTAIFGDQTYKTVVTSVATGNGLTGGTITTTGTLSVLANSGIITNSTGVFVNANNGIIANATGIYVNASAIAIGTVPAARLPLANATSNGAVLILDSVTNTSIDTYAASANSVKNAYDRAIDANTRAASAQTAASAAYTNATAFASNASNLSTGTVPGARLSGTYGNALTLSNNSNIFTGNGQALTVNGSNITTGTVPAARLGTGTANSTTYLRGDGTWSVINNYWIMETDIGDGSATSFTLNVFVSNATFNYKVGYVVKENSTGEIVYPDIREPNNSHVIVTFTSAPSANQYNLKVLVV